MNEEIIEYLEKNIKKKRFRHSLRVAKTAKKLAEIHQISVDKAYRAALLHDGAKGIEEEFFRRYEKIISEEWQNLEEDLKSKAICHGPLAAILAREEFGIEDKEILDAITYHTTGRENMSKMDKIIYLADKIELKREYPMIEEIRKAAKTDLDKAMLLSFDNTIEYLIQAKEPIALITIKSRNKILRR